MEKSLKIDKVLYQKLVGFYSDNYHLPPLAARIYAYLTFDFDNAGVTFDEFVEVLKASKSSVSSNLQLLQTNGYLKVINKIDERKRFFILNPDYVTIRFNNLIENLEKEKENLESLKDFRRTQEPNENSENYITKLNIYISLLKTNIENLSETLQKLKQ